MFLLNSTRVDAGAIIGDEVVGCGDEVMPISAYLFIKLLIKGNTNV